MFFWTRGSPWSVCSYNDLILHPHCCLWLRLYNSMFFILAELAPHSLLFSSSPFWAILVSLSHDLSVQSHASIPHWKPVHNFIRMVLNLPGKLQKIDLFMILGLPFHKHPMSAFPQAFCALRMVKSHIFVTWISRYFIFFVVVRQVSLRAILTDFSVVLLNISPLLFFFRHFW